MDKLRQWAIAATEWIKAKKLQILQWGVIGVVVWYGIVGLWWLIKVILCLGFGICILFP